MCFRKRIDTLILRENAINVKDIMVFSYFQMKFPQIMLMENDDFIEEEMLYIYRVNKEWVFLIDRNVNVWMCKTNRCKYFSIYSRDDIFRMLIEYGVIKIYIIKNYEYE